MIFSRLKKNLVLRRWKRSLRLYRIRNSMSNAPFSELNKKKAESRNQKCRRVLIATSVGAHIPAVILESYLAAALIMREAEVHILLCDGKLPACLDCVLEATISEKELACFGPSKRLCRACWDYSFHVFSSMGFPVLRFSDFLTPQEERKIYEIELPENEEKLRVFSYLDIPVGEHAWAGALRFYARGTIEDEPYRDEILNRYLRAAMITARVMKNLYEKESYDCALFHHGIYIPQGVIGEVSRRNNIRIVNWNPAYRSRCFIFSHGDTYHHTLMNEPTGQWDLISWNPRLKKMIMEYLESRRQGTHDWIYFHEKPKEDKDWIRSELGIRSDIPCIGLLTNVFWDAQLHYPANAFSNMMEWIIETIYYFIHRPELNLVIRIHPAEIRGSIPSRQTVKDEIFKEFHKLPGNIIVIPPESPISTYSVMELCNAAIIYGTKTGVELTSMGIPVIVAGEAWIRNKGITFDARTKDEYFSFLDRLPFEEQMGEEKLAQARKYAFHFFFRRMIPLRSIIPRKGWPPYQVDISDISTLLPGKDLGLDVICEGILRGAPFIFPVENHPDEIIEIGT